jgi:hypothetical protein
MWLADLWVQVKGVDYTVSASVAKNCVILLDGVALNKRHIIDPSASMSNLAECTVR